MNHGHRNYPHHLPGRRAGDCPAGVREIYLPFLTLIALLGLLLIWRVLAVRFEVLAVVFLGLSGVFLFYAVNYRTLVIRLNSELLALTFGLFTVIMDNDPIAH